MMGEKDVKTDVAAAAAEMAQIKYCEERNLPLFAPPGGLCFYCGRSVYIRGPGNISAVEWAGRDHLTGCPFCHRSFLE